MKRRRIICPREYHDRRNPGRKKLTPKKIGLLHAKMRADGRVCSSPVTAPPDQATVWIDKNDPYAPVMELAARGNLIDAEKLGDELGYCTSMCESHEDFTQLGIALVPHRSGKIRLVGTSPTIARLVNRAHHGRRRRTLSKRQLLQLVLGLKSNGRAITVTEKRLLTALQIMQSQFSLDLSDLINRDSISI